MRAHMAHTAKTNPAWLEFVVKKSTLNSWGVGDKIEMIFVVKLLKNFVQEYCGIIIACENKLHTCLIIHIHGTGGDSRELIKQVRTTTVGKKNNLNSSI